MELDWSVRSDTPGEQRSRSDSAPARVVVNSGGGHYQQRYAGCPMNPAAYDRYSADQAALLDGNFFP